MVSFLFWVLLLVVLGSAVLALGYAFFTYGFVKNIAVDEEHKKVSELSDIIHEGAMAFLNSEYKWLAPFVVVVGALLCTFLSIPSGVCFVFGALCSALTGYCGMIVATRSNGRTTFMATKSMNDALGVAFRGGSVMGMTVVGVGLAGVVLSYVLFRDANVITSFGLGASSIALFARVGGGIYTKAADVGADLVGKVEAGIPEDDPRNPATIADNVGDNVGDIAGMGADLFESYVNSIIAAMAVGFVTTMAGDSAPLGLMGVLYPLALAALGIAAAIFGSACVTGSLAEENDSKMGQFASKYLFKFMQTGNATDPAKALSLGTYITGIIEIVGALILSLVLLQDIKIFFAVVSGVVAGVAIGMITEYYTSADYKPVQKLAGTTETGPATVILGGISLGMTSTVIPVLLICAATLISYFFSGLYGVACSAVGMLSITGMSLSVDAYGPISDNAGGIAEMSELPEGVRNITDKLDAVGNTTAAMGKGLAIGSAALTALSLFSAYAQAAGLRSIDLNNPHVMVGLFLGGMLPFLFSAQTIAAVQEAAGKMVEEVRRQFREHPGIMDYSEKPDYKKCVAISTDASLHKMIVPGLLAIVVPVVVGFALDAEALGGLLGGAIVTGVMLAVYMSNAGGAWDNAKKYIESGVHGGKGSANHKAAVVGDTVGDPFKDTAGPSLNILIKLMTVVALVIAPLIMK
ncbi:MULTISPECIES: sodium-translocating pyrophosphatase [unclassified Pyramidobacter]|uniref:sodium-translocating pyrophosphatase n=1 Tax=unclassified Pyramidobacter TaxID=2632171 RepID=UPI000EA1236B|nr:sodium-translocating pyrophosphatase [Pyramidobacter sp. CG50-2]RKJ81339.1 sodium-translocating pyrophosphatase [Pyramidobacter sp. CG50-2]